MAVAVIVTLPLTATVAPFAGLVSVTVGATATMVTFTGADVTAGLPALLSVA